MSCEEPEKITEFKKELSSLINKYSLEHIYGDTPDFILADYINRCLNVFTYTLEQRAAWYK